MSLSHKIEHVCLSESNVKASLMHMNPVLMYMIFSEYEIILFLILQKASVIPVAKMITMQLTPHTTG